MAAGSFHRLRWFGQIEIEEAERGHQRRVMRGDEVAVVAKVRIGGRQMLGVVVSRGGRRAVGIVDQRALQFVGNHAEFVTAHVQQRVHAASMPTLYGVEMNSP